MIKIKTKFQDFNQVFTYITYMNLISKFIKIYFLVLIPLLCGSYILCSMDTYAPEVEIKISHDLVSQFKKENSEEYTFSLKAGKKYNITSAYLYLFERSPLIKKSITFIRLQFFYQSYIKEKNHLKTIRARSPTLS